MSSDGLWLGKELAYQMGISPGDSVQIISPLETEGPLESVPRLRTFRIEGIVDSGLPEKDLHTAYAPMKAVGSFLQKNSVVNQVEVHVRDFEQSVNVAKTMRTVLGSDFLVKDWEQLNAHLFASLRLERITMFVILTVIILVASFNIVTSLKMLVIEKRKEIAILRAMGATAKQIRGVFFIQGAVIANLGALLGAFLGLGVAWALKHYDFKLPDIFYDRNLPVVISPVLVVFVVVVAILIVLLATYFPARSAVKLSPIEGIRHG
jgi:lipoprotein-releasing system permease protein